LNLSRLEATLIRITEQEAESFHIELEALVTRTGPVSATLLPMDVDLIGSKGKFGVLTLPEIKTVSSGTKVHVTPQKVAIVSHEAFQAFVKAITLDEKIVLHLDNGKGKIKALFMSANIVYKKDVDIVGMNGPKIEIVSTVPGPDDTFKNTLKILNPSPLEITIPTNTFHYIDEEGTVIAEQHGELAIVRGDSYHEVSGKVLKKNPKGTVRLVGIDVEKETWMKTTIKYFDGVIALTPELKALFA